MQHFGDGGVRVDGPAQFQGGAFQQFGHRQLTQQFGNLRAAEVAAQEFAVAGVNHQLDQAVGFAHSYRLAAGLDIEAADFDIITLFPRLGFGQAERRHLGMAVGGAGHQGVVQRLHIRAGDGFHRRNALGGGDVGQRQFAGDIAHRVDAGDVGGHAVVNGDVAAFGGHAGGFQAQVFGVGLYADGDQRLVKARRFSGAILINREGYAAGIRLGAGDGGAGLHLDAVPPEGAFQLLADFGILVGDDVRQQLNDGDLGAVHPIDVGEFHADGAAADDGYRTGDGVIHDGLAAGDDALAVHRQRGDAAGAGAGGDDDIARPHAAGLPVGRRHFHRARRQDAGGAGEVGDIVLAEQVADAPGHPSHHLAAAGYGDGVIRRKVVKAQAELVGAVDVGEDFGVFQQRFGGDAAPVEAHAAQGFAFNHAGRHTQLAGADAGHIAAGAAADYGYIIFGVGRHQSVLPPGALVWGALAPAALYPATPAAASCPAAGAGATAFGMRPGPAAARPCCITASCAAAGSPSV